MAGRIEDYALIGDTRTVALVCNDGSIDWLCVPQIDSGACFAALLGDEEHGRWQIAPKAEPTSVTRQYEGETLILRTDFETATGSVTLYDFMVPETPRASVHRIVECRGGYVDMTMDLAVRFDYGSIVPWVQSTGDGHTMVAGPDGLRFHSSVPLVGRDMRTQAEFRIQEGSVRAFSLTYYDGEGKEAHPLDSLAARERTRRWWDDWVARCTYKGGWRDEVMRSLITLKALTFDSTGAVCAAATTSLPEDIGGVRNWDYRFSWLRDATMTMQSFLIAGYRQEAAAWSQWLRRAVAGDPKDFQIMYGVEGHRRLTELTLDWLPGYESSAPVRIGNAASNQFQLDVFGEIMDAILTGARNGLNPSSGYRDGVVFAMLSKLEEVWQEPDEGIWEVRGPRRHFTHSKMMAWVAFDRAVRLAKADLLDHDDSDHWAELRDTIHRQVCERAWNADVGAYTQYYGSDKLDASLLMMCQVGFLPADDERMVATIEAIQRELVTDGFVKRYQTDSENADGLPGSEGAFLLTTFWLADALAFIGRNDEAEELFGRLCGLANDVGLLSEEYDPQAKRMLGNFPQAFSHLGLINTAANLSLADDAPRAERAAGAHPVPNAGTNLLTDPDSTG